MCQSSVGRILKDISGGIDVSGIDAIDMLRNDLLKNQIMKGMKRKTVKRLLDVFRTGALQDARQRYSSISKSKEVRAFITKGILGEMAGDIGDAYRGE